MFCVILVLCVLVITVTAIPNEFKRDIVGLFPGGTPPASSTHPTTHISIKISTKSSPSPSATLALSTARLSSELSTPIPSFQSHLVVPTTPTGIKTSQAATPSTSPDSQLTTTDHSSKTWQIIGIAIIAVLFIATTITCGMFFDRLWRFLKDVICCTSHPLVAEELIPDCEEQSWDTRTLSPSPSDLDREAPSLHTIRTRELPWDIEPQHRNTFHRQLSQRNDHPPPA